MLHLGRIHPINPVDPGSFGHQGVLTHQPKETELCLRNWHFLRGTTVRCLKGLAGSRPRWQGVGRSVCWVVEGMCVCVWRWTWHWRWRWNHKIADCRQAMLEGACDGHYGWCGGTMNVGWSVKSHIP